MYSQCGPPVNSVYLFATLGGLSCVVLHCVVFIKNNDWSYQVCNPNVPAAPNRDGVRSQNNIGRASLEDDGDANKQFLTSLFINKELGIQLLKDVGLLRSKLTFITLAVAIWPGALDQNSWTVSDGDGGGHLLPYAVLPRLSGTAHGVSRVTSLSRRLCSPHTTSWRHNDDVFTIYLLFNVVYS